MMLGAIKWRLSNNWNCLNNWCLVFFVSCFLKIGIVQTNDHLGDCLLIWIVSFQMIPQAVYRLEFRGNCFGRPPTIWNCPNEWFRKRSTDWDYPRNRVLESSDIWKVAATCRATVDLVSTLQDHVIVLSVNNRVGKLIVYPLICKVFCCAFLRVVSI